MVVAVVVIVVAELVLVLLLLLLLVVVPGIGIAVVIAAVVVCGGGRRYRGSSSRIQAYIHTYPSNMNLDHCRTEWCCGTGELPAPQPTYKPAAREHCQKHPRKALRSIHGRRGQDRRAFQQQPQQYRELCGVQ